MQLKGHEQARVLLKQVSAHTLLFVGPDRVGRRQVARWYAAWLNCQRKSSEAKDPCWQCPSCQAFLVSENPDYKEVAPETVTSTGRQNRRPEIKISQLVPRKESEDIALSRWLELRPSFSWRVAVIDSAHLLNVSAANAFLKTLEEPPPKTKIILIAPSAEATLPTIASRSSIIRFAPDKNLAAESFVLARLGRFGDEVAHETYCDLLPLLDSYIDSLNKTLEEAFEAADVMQKQWENYPDAGILLTAKFSTYPAAVFAKAVEAIDAFSDALAAYASAPIAIQVLTLELRKAMRVGN